MTRIVKLVAGAVLILLGIVWTLQGLNIMGGSGMSGHAVWAVIGVIIIVVGGFIFVRAIREQHAPDDL
jgi:uncharacterized membrane protein HdeD (DUF308 family)